MDIPLLQAERPTVAHEIKSGGFVGPPPAWSAIGASGVVTGISAVDINGRPHALTAGKTDDTVRIWDLLNRTQVGQLIGHFGAVNAVAVTTVNGKPLAVTASDDWTMRTWDLATYAEIGQLPGQAKSSYWTPAARAAEPQGNGQESVEVNVPPDLMPANKQAAALLTPERNGRTSVNEASSPEVQHPVSKQQPNHSTESIATSSTAPHPVTAARTKPNEDPAGKAVAEHARVGIAESDLGVNAALLVTHLLTKYSAVLPGNPRLIIRVATAWAMLRAVAGSLNLSIEGEHETDLLVRAAIIWVRFPVLADEILDADEPPIVDPTRTDCSPRWRRRDVQEVLTTSTGPLRIEDLAAYYGKFFSPEVPSPVTKEK